MIEISHSLTRVILMLMVQCISISLQST